MDTSVFSSLQVGHDHGVVAVEIHHGRANEIEYGQRCLCPDSYTGDDNAALRLFFGR